MNKVQPRGWPRRFLKVLMRASAVDEEGLESTVKKGVGHVTLLLLLAFPGTVRCPQSSLDLKRRQCLNVLELWGKSRGEDIGSAIDRGNIRRKRTWKGK
jgi:hypothetical protein